MQAKYDATVHLAQAERAGAELIDQAIASAVEVGADGRVSGVRYKRPDGSEARATAKVYVIAAHGIETPKLLLQSRTTERPHGVANSSDQVGRNLMDHPTRLSWALTAERLYPFRGPLSTGGIESPRAGNWRAEYGAFRVQLQNRGWEWAMGTPDHTVRKLAERGLRGADLTQALADHSERELGSGDDGGTAPVARESHRSQTTTSAMPSGFRVRASPTALTTTAVGRSTVASAFTRRSSRR